MTYEGGKIHNYIIKVYDFGF